MSFNLRNRSFLKEIDFEPRELRFLLKLAEALKLAKYAGTEVQRLTGKEIALIFEKTSTRTRSAFEVASYDQGAHVTYLDPSGSQLGHKESIADTAAVLGRMYDAIEFRGNAQSDVEELAAHAGVPVYNGLTDEWHPTQMLADFLTMHESSNKPYDRSPTPSWGLPLQHGPLPAGHGRADGQRRPPVRPGRTPPAQGRRRSRPGHRRADRRAHHHHRGPRAGRRRRRLHPHRRVGLDGRGQGRLGRTGAGPDSLPGQRRPDAQGRQPAPSSSCTACPPSTTRTPSSDARSWSTPA